MGYEPTQASQGYLSSPISLRQRRFRYGEPKDHVHGTVHRDGAGECGAGQGSAACLAVQRAETAVTVRLQWAHAEPLGQSEGLLIVSLGLHDIGWLVPCSDVTEQA